MSKLTALKVKNAGPGKHGDGRGLTLVVSDSRAKKWVLRIQSNGVRRDLGLGSASHVSLAEARSAAEEVRRSLREGKDPRAERARATNTIPAFAEAASLVHEEHKASWRNTKHAGQWISTLERYAFPQLGNRPVNEIDAPMIRDVLAPIWLEIPETAKRVKQRIGTVLDFAHAKGWRDTEAPMRSVTRGLAKQSTQQNHFAALPWPEVPSFVAGMSETLKTAETVRLALEFLILTAARSGEVREACWSEVDLKKKVWTIPAARMKAGRAHRVPLSSRAIEILERMRELRRSDDPDAFIFEGQKPGRPFSDMTLSMPLRRTGLHFTVHGFRSSFRDWCAEATDTPREVAEACLAHRVKGVEAAYARTDHFERRRAVMEAWSAFATEQAFSMSADRR